MASILVVEDDASVARLLALVVGMEGHACELAATGAAATARFRDVPVDLVLLDVMLPDADGIELLTELRRMPGWAATKVVILTALDGDRDVWRGWAAGTDYYLTKPFDLDQLRHVIDRLLAGETPGHVEREARPLVG